MDSRRYIFFPDNLLRVGFFSQFIAINKDNLFNASDSISDDIKQTLIADCYFLSALRSIVRRYPRFVDNAIEVLANGHIAVLFYVQTEHRETMPVWFELESTIIKHLGNKLGGHSANWVYLFEKAYVFYRLQEQDLIDINGSEAKIKSAVKNFNFYDVLDGGLAHKVFKALLGCKAKSHYIPHPCHSIIKLLTYAGEEIGEEIREFIFKNDLALVKDFAKCYSANIHKHVLKKLLRKIKSGEATVKEVIAYFEVHTPELNINTLDAIRASALKSIEITIGHSRYSVDSLHSFNLIHSLLKSGELLCASTKLKFPKRESSKGLVEEHEYDLLNCYIRGDNYFFLLGNPWGNYVRGYKLANENSSKLQPVSQYSIFSHGRSFGDLKRVASNSRLSFLARDDEQHSPEKMLNKPGYFEMELNDFMWRFETIETTELMRTKKKLHNLIIPFNPENENLMNRLELIDHLQQRRNSL